jgi:hypothetical protein
MQAMQRDFIYQQREKGLGGFLTQKNKGQGYL